MKPVADDIEIKLTGEDGNIFSILGRVTNMMKSKGYYHLARRLTDEIVTCGSYSDALKIIQKYVNVV